MRKIFNRFSKRTKIIASIGTILVLGLFVFYIYPTFIFSKPLGNKLEYIGKTDYGCWLVCDSEPASVYYYATDLTLDGVTRSLFQHAKLNEKPQLGSTTLIHTDIYYQWVKYTNPKREHFSIDYYSDTSALRNFYHFRKTSKPHIISIGSESYETAKNSL